MSLHEALEPLVLARVQVPPKSQKAQCPLKATKQFILGGLASVEKLKGVAATCQNRAAVTCSCSSRQFQCLCTIRKHVVHVMGRTVYMINLVQEVRLRLMLFACVLCVRNRCVVTVSDRVYLLLRHGAEWQLHSE